MTSRQHGSVYSVDGGGKSVVGQVQHTVPHTRALYAILHTRALYAIPHTRALYAIAVYVVNTIVPRQCVQ